ncbi:MAG: DUF1365 domain-containing protein [Gammaproteobacteria bacterium]
MKSGIFEGYTTHKRLLPISHFFSYRLMMLYLDLDELDNIFKNYWLWSFNKKNISCFLNKDHGFDQSVNMKLEILKLVLGEPINLYEWQVRILTHLRYFGYCFNPICVYYIFDQSEQLRHVVAEVKNTPWGEMHRYIFKDFEIKTQAITEKLMHVSPFLPINFNYHFRFRHSFESIYLHIKNIMNEQEHFNASLSLKRKPITPFNMARILIRYPLMTYQVIAKIYYQAAKLWFKGARFYTHPKKLKQN